MPVRRYHRKTYSGIRKKRARFDSTIDNLDSLNGEMELTDDNSSDTLEAQKNLKNITNSNTSIDANVANDMEITGNLSTETDNLGSPILANSKGLEIPSEGPAYLSPEPPTVNSLQIEAVLEFMPSCPKLQKAFLRWTNLTSSERKNLRQFVAEMSKGPPVNGSNDGFSFYPSKNNAGFGHFNWNWNRNIFTSGLGGFNSAWTSKTSNSNRIQNGPKILMAFLNLTHAFGVWSNIQRYRGACGYTEPQQDDTASQDSNTALKVDFRDDIYKMAGIILEYVSKNLAAEKQKAKQDADDDW